MGRGLFFSPLPLASLPSVLLGSGTDPGTIGFHLSALYSPVGWLSWSDIARMWEVAQATDEAKRSFKNGVLGLTWVETGEAPDWQRLYERRESWHGTVPSCGLFLTAGADVQKDRIEIDIWGLGRKLARRPHRHR